MHSDRPGRQILAGLAYVLPRLMAGADAGRIAVAFDLLLHDHGVCALRHLGTRHNAHALARARCRFERLSGPGRADHVQ